MEPSTPSESTAAPVTGVAEAALPVGQAESAPDAASGLAQPGNAELDSVALPRMFTALKYSNFRQVWIGNFMSNIGTWMQNVAQGWLVLQLTDSAFWVGVVSFAAAAPLLVFTMWGGVIADNVDRRKMLLYAQYVMAGSALALSVLCFTHTVRVGHVLVLALLTGVAAAVAAPAQQALVPMLVPRDVLTNAIGLNSAQFNMSRVVGPTVGGFFIAWFGAGGNFAFNALSFVALMVALQRITLIQPEPKDPTSSLWVRLRAGLRYVWGKTSMTLLILLVCVTALLGIPYISFAPVFARDVLHVGAEGLGLLMAFAGLGSFFAALTIAYSGNPRRRGGWMALSGTVFFCAVMGFSFSRNFALSSALLFVAGYAVIILVALINTRLQHSADEEMRGRAMSIYSTAYLGLPPVGSFAAGFLSRWMEAPLAIAAMAAAGLGIFLIMFGTSPQLRNME